MNQDLDPEYLRDMARDEQFRFSCHPGVACFNECCRELELALTPYDVLRLKGALGLTSGQFLEQYALIEHTEEEPFPRVFLGMVDDGRGSCPFVSAAGCRVYADRPGACRMYPLARGAYRTPEGGQGELFMLVTEPHCLGFREANSHSVEEWIGEQEAMAYNALNDQVLAILRHGDLRQGQSPGQEQQRKFLLSLYDLDRFREMVFAPGFHSPVAPSSLEMKKIAANELALLGYGLRWLRWELFGEKM